jgi:hypothetical protein
MFLYARRFRVSVNPAYGQHRPVLGGPGALAGDNRIKKYPDAPVKDSALNEGQACQVIVLGRKPLENESD